MSYHELVAALKRTAPEVALRHAFISSVAADGSVTLAIGGDTVTIAGVKVASSCCPIAGTACLVAIVGSDLFVLGSLGVAVAHAHMARANPQTIPNATWTQVSFDTAEADPYDMHVVGAPTRITVATPGIYTVSSYVYWASVTSGSRLIAINLSGASKGATKVVAVGSGYMAFTQEVRATQGQYLELSVYQDTGGDLSLVAAKLRASWKSPL